MRWVLLGLNTLAAIGVFLGAQTALAINRVHSLSVHQELVARGAIASEPVKAQDSEDPLDANGNYDSARRLENIGNIEGNFSLLGSVAAAVFLINGMCFAFGARFWPPHLGNPTAVLKAD